MQEEGGHAEQEPQRWTSSNHYSHAFLIEPSIGSYSWHITKPLTSPRSRSLTWSYSPKSGRNSIKLIKLRQEGEGQNRLHPPLYHRKQSTSRAPHQTDVVLLPAACRVEGYMDKPHGIH